MRIDITDVTYDERMLAGIRLAYEVTIVVSMC